MVIKADKEKLANTSNNLVKSSNSIKEEIDLWKKTVDELKQVWKGKDADTFYNRMDAYLIKLDMLTESSNAIGTFIGTVNSKYIEKDEEFTENIRRENDKYEEPIEQSDNYI